MLVVPGETVGMYGKPAVRIFSEGCRDHTRTPAWQGGGRSYRWFESMSNVPYFLMGARDGFKMGNRQLVDGMFSDGFMDAFYNIHMGETVENIAKMFNISWKSRMSLSASHHRACEY